MDNIMSSMNDNLSQEKFIIRVKILSNYLKSSGVDIESITALNRANRSGYKTKGSLPSFTTLQSLALECDVNLNWFLTGQGEMLLAERGAATEGKSMGAAAVPPSEREVALERENSILRELVDSKQGELAKAEKIITLYESQERGPQTIVTSKDAAPSALTTLSARLNAKVDPIKE